MGKIENLLSSPKTLMIFLRQINNPPNWNKNMILKSLNKKKVAAFI